MLGLNKVPWTAKYVACGEHHTAFMTCCGQLFTSGKNDYGQLGLNSTDPRSSTLSKVQLDNKVAKGVPCGRDYTLLVAADDSGMSVWGCGNNCGDQLALDSVIHGFYVIGFVELDTIHLKDLRPEDKHVRVACGDTHSVVAWGNVIATTGIQCLGR
jgi:alpha-tubulin suppressor-like RCC1 family protein